MSRGLIVLAGVLVLAFAVACGSSDDESGGAAVPGRVADLSEFPTPSGSQASPQREPQASQDDDESGTSVDEPMSPEELQQLMRRLRSGELSEEEAQEALRRLQGQFSGGPGAGPAGQQAVGTVESIGQNAITVATEVAVVTVTVGEDTDIRITSVLEPAALTDGAQVIVVSERVGGSTVAGTIAIVPDGLGGFGGGQARPGGFGGPQGGQGGGPALFGTVGSIDDNGFILETQQGPLPITVTEESVIVRTGPGTIADLEAGMHVRVSGPVDEDGRMDARSIVVTPEGLDGIPGPGGRGGGGSRSGDGA